MTCILFAIFPLLFYHAYSEGTTEATSTTQPPDEGAEGSYSIWDDENGNPCGKGMALARMVCIPWNYTKEFLPLDGTEVDQKLI